MCVDHGPLTIVLTANFPDCLRRRTVSLAHCAHINRFEELPEGSLTMTIVQSTTGRWQRQQSTVAPDPESTPESKSFMFPYQPDGQSNGLHGSPNSISRPAPSAFIDGSIHADPASKSLAEVQLKLAFFLIPKPLQVCNVLFAFSRCHVGHLFSIPMSSMKQTAVGVCAFAGNQQRQPFGNSWPVGPMIGSSEFPHTFSSQS